MKLSQTNPQGVQQQHYPGLEILTRSENPKAAIVIVHGMGDHCRALPYNLLSEHLLSKGYETGRFDLPCHGVNMNNRQVVRNWHDLSGKCFQSINHISNEAKGTQLFLLGLSLGGMIALNYASRYPEKINGVISVSPALDTSGAPVMLQWMVKMISKLAPGLRASMKLDLTNISRELKLVNEYTSDKYWQKNTTTGFAAAVLEGIRETKQLAGQLVTSVLVLQGTEDRIVPNQGGLDYFEKIKSSDKKLKQYTGLYHNLFLEPEKDKVFEDIGNWIVSRIGGA